MAITGFHPVRGSAKNLIAYISDREKTDSRNYPSNRTDPVPQEDSTAGTPQEERMALVSQDNSTSQIPHTGGDEQQAGSITLISGINCNVDRAFEEMQAILKRFGIRGRNVAYHVCQSFPPGEITPELAHQIGIETARRMWGDRFQVLVTTHLNTDKIHNHMAVCAVSFLDGKKFKNRRSDHYRFREISDAICREHGLSVLEDSPFYGQKRGTYWVHRNGGRTSRDIVKQEVAESLKYSYDYKLFSEHLMSRGYYYDQRRNSISAPDWNRDIRLDSLGFTKEVISRKLDRNNCSLKAWINCYHHPPDMLTRFPMQELQHEKHVPVALILKQPERHIPSVFRIQVALANLTVDAREGRASYRPLSPTVRMQSAHLKSLTLQLSFLQKNRIQTVPDLTAYIEDREKEIKHLEKERQHFNNLRRRPKAPEVQAELKKKAHAITEALKPIREDLKAARKISRTWKPLSDMLRCEHEMEASERAFALEAAAARERAHVRNSGMER